VHTITFSLAQYMLRAEQGFIYKRCLGVGGSFHWIYVYDWCIMLTKTRWSLVGACVRHTYLFWLC